jgi:myosin protein heavy chain
MDLDGADDPAWPYLRASREQQTKDAATPFDSKRNCWIVDAEDGFVAASIKHAKVSVFVCVLDCN